MRTFIIAGTEVVISRNGKYEWYTTKTEVEITNYNVAFCPLRDSIEVLTAEVKGFRIWFLDNQMSVELTEEQMNFVNMHRFVKVEYDIPVRVSTRPAQYIDENGNSFSHPSTWFWAFGVRTSESVWMLTEERYKAVQFRLRRLTRAGCKWKPTWIDAGNVADHLRTSIIEMRKAWAAADKSYNDCLERAEAEYANGNRSNEAERKLKYARTRIEKELDKRRENITQSARLYNIPMEWIIGTGTGAATVKAVTNGTVTITPPTVAVEKVLAKQGKDKNEAHCATVEALRDSDWLEAQSIAEEMNSGRVDYFVIADFCQDKNILCDENGKFIYRDVLCS